MVTRWSRSTSNFYALIGQIWRVNSCGKFMQHLETCLLFLTAEADIVLCQLVRWCFLMSFSTGWTKWNTAAIKSLLLFMAGLFIGFLVEKSVACQNSIIRFRMASFLFFTLLKCVRGFKSLKQLWPSLIAFRTESRMVSLSNYCIWCLVLLYLISWSLAPFTLTVFAASFCTFVAVVWVNDLT